MARDPFAPHVVEEGIPKWVWIVVAGFAVMLIGLGTTMAIVLSKRNSQVAAQKALPPPTETPPAATPPPAAGPETAANDKSGDDKGEKGDKPSAPRKHKSSGGGGHSKPAAESKPSAPPPPPKPKKVMEQKDIDKLLGL